MLVVLLHEVPHGGHGDDVARVEELPDGLAAVVLALGPHRREGVVHPPELVLEGPVVVAVRVVHGVDDRLVARDPLHVFQADVHVPEEVVIRRQNEPGHDSLPERVC